MTIRPEVSVIIPTRDALQWLPSASHRSGRTRAVEILVVDDGSTDGTLAWLGRLAVADPRVRFMHGSRPGRRAPESCHRRGEGAAGGLSRCR